MSTILRALQKNKLGQQAGTRYKTKPNAVWRVMVLGGIALIIILLSALLYTRLFPVVEPKPIGTKQVLKPVSKIVFQTQSIPEKKQAKTIIYVAKHTKKTVRKAIPAPTKKETVKEDDKDQALAKKEQQEMDAVSEKMKQRFALAVSLTDDEVEVDNANINDAKNKDGLESPDGSDIRDMSSSFQRSVPAISYESHVYSSISDDRWVKINGETLKEGDFDRSGKLEVVDIQPQRTVFRRGAQSFTLESLVDWKG